MDARFVIVASGHVGLLADGSDAGGEKSASRPTSTGARPMRGLHNYANEPLSRTRPVADGFAATATATPASAFDVLVVVNSLLVLSQ